MQHPACPSEASCTGTAVEASSSVSKCILLQTLQRWPAGFGRDTCQHMIAMLTSPKAGPWRAAKELKHLGQQHLTGHRLGHGLQAAASAISEDGTLQHGAVSHTSFA